MCAGGGFGGERGAVVGWTALHHVADVDTIASVTHRGDHAIEQLAGSPDEWEALLILVKAGALPDKNEVGSGGSPRENALGSAAAQLATRAFGRVVGQYFEASLRILSYAIRSGLAHGRLLRRRSLRHWKPRTSERFLPM
jgi:hypothetical protein